MKKHKLEISIFLLTLCCALLCTVFLVNYTKASLVSDKKILCCSRNLYDDEQSVL